MLKKPILFTLILTILANLIACQSKVESVKGIKIAGVDGALYHNTTAEQNAELQRLIKGVLAKDKSAVKALLDFDCGGGAGCYDLGFVVTQLLDKMGEDEFIKLIDGLKKEDKSMLSSLIRVGLEYGYQPDSSRTIENSLPKLNQVLTKD